MKITRKQLNKIILKEMKRFFPDTPAQTRRRDQVMTRKGLGPVDQPGSSSPLPPGEYSTLHTLSRLDPDKEPTLPNFIDDLMFGMGYSRAPMYKNYVGHNSIFYTYEFKIPGAQPIYATFNANYHESDYKTEEDPEMSPGQYKWYIDLVADHVYLKSPDKYGGSMRSIKDQVEVAMDFHSKRYDGKIDDGFSSLRRPNKRYNYSSVGRDEHPGINNPKEFNHLMMNVEQQLASKLEKIKKDISYIKKAYILQRVEMDPKLKPYASLKKENGMEKTRQEHNEHLNQVISLGAYANPPIPSDILRMLDQIPLQS